MIKIINKDIKCKILVLDKIKKEINFKRIFFLIANKTVIRGNHAHKKCIQAFFSIKGNFYINCIFINGEKKKILIKPGDKLKVIKPLTWVSVHLKKGNICGVLCDRNYENKDYIREYKYFSEIKNKI
tara:strand:+ start:322 stop:702 length:381 start_codon:yes stop_codon:yes gene_type:complete